MVAIAVVAFTVAYPAAWWRKVLGSGESGERAEKLGSEEEDGVVV
jgi:hypothetical protein